jgi:heme/copper-type cytochrome/quinol oxidase subunit 2
MAGFSVWMWVALGVVWVVFPVCWYFGFVYPYRRIQKRYPHEDTSKWIDWEDY